LETEAEVVEDKKKEKEEKKEEGEGEEKKLEEEKEHLQRAKWLPSTALQESPEVGKGEAFPIKLCKVSNLV
jgi:hypothetical protein